MRFFLRILVIFMLLMLQASGVGDVQAKKKVKAPVKKEVRKGKGGGNVKKPDTTVEAKKMQAQTRQEIAQAEAQLKENEKEVGKKLAELGKVEGEISVSKKRIGELQGRINRLGQEINGLEAGIYANEKELGRLRDEYLKAVKKMRVARRNRSELAFIFASGSFREAERRMRYLREFSIWRGRQTESIKERTAELESQKESLAKVKEEQQNGLVIQKKIQESLEDQQKRQAGLLADLRRNGEALRSHLRKKQAEAKELDELVSNLIAREREMASAKNQVPSAARGGEVASAKNQEPSANGGREVSSAKNQEPSAEGGRGMASAKNQLPSTGGKGGKASAKNQVPKEYADARRRAPRSKNKPEKNNEGKQDNAKELNQNKANGGKGGDKKKEFSEMRGLLSHPSTGSFAVTCHFGRQFLPELGDVEFDNPGIDAETEEGASARAVFGGEVSGVYMLPGYDTVVIVNHGGYYTVYGNISSPSVKTGDPVGSGSLLGRLSRSEEDSGKSKIHFEVWKGREKLDPEEWLK